MPLKATAPSLLTFLSFLLYFLLLKLRNNPTHTNRGRMNEVTAEGGKLELITGLISIQNTSELKGRIRWCYCMPRTCGLTPLKVEQRKQGNQSGVRGNGSHMDAMMLPPLPLTFIVVEATATEPHTSASFISQKQVNQAEKISYKLKSIFTDVSVQPSIPPSDMEFCLLLTAAGNIWTSVGQKRSEQKSQVREQSSAPEPGTGPEPGPESSTGCYRPS